MAIPDDFRSLLPKVAAEADGEPFYYLWVFDPHTGEVTIEHNEGRHPAEHIDHTELAQRVPHPDRIHGYAYRIGAGWRITTWEHRPVEDAYIHNQVAKELSKR